MNMLVEYKKAFSEYLQRIYALCRTNPVFCFAFSVWLVWKVALTSMFSFIDGALVNTVIHFFLLLLFLGSSVSSFKVDKNFFVSLCLFIIGVFIKIFSNDFLIADLAIIFYCSNSIGFKDVARLSFGVLSLTVLIVVLLSQIGLIEDYIFVQGTRLRHGLGFLYTSYVSHYYLELVLLFIYIRGTKISNLEICILGGLDFCIFLLTDAKSPFLLAALSLVLILLVRSTDVLRKIPAFAGIKVSKYAFTLFAVVSLLLALAYNPSFSLWQKANDFSNGRIKLSNQALSEYGITIFGNEVDFVGNGLKITEEGYENPTAISEDDYNFIDNMYMNLLISDGLITLVVIVLMTQLAVNYFIRTQNGYMCLIIVLLAFDAFVDHQPLYLHFNVFLIGVWKAFLIELDAYVRKAPLRSSKHFKRSRLG